MVSEVEERGNVKKDYCCSCFDELFGCRIGSDSCHQQLFMYAQIKSHGYNTITKASHSQNVVLGYRICKRLKFFLIFLKIGKKDIKAIALLTVNNHLKREKREPYFFKW